MKASRTLILIGVALIAVFVLLRVFGPDAEKKPAPAGSAAPAESAAADGSSDPSGTAEPSGQGEYDGDMPRFSRIVYRRPDLDGITADYEELIEALGGEGLSVPSVVARLEQLYAEYDEFCTMSVVAELRWYHDVTDEFYADECDWFLEHDPVMDQLFESLCAACANCEIAEELDEQFWGGWVVDAYQGEDSATLDPDFVALLQKENEIIAEYRRASTDPTVRWKGKECSFWALQEDDSLSEADWEEVRSLYYDKYAPILGEIYLRLLAVRQELADYLGLDSYEDYAYLALYSRDYGPEQAERLLEAIRQELAPLYGELDLNRRWEALRYTELSEEENLDAIYTAARQMGGVVRSAYADMERYELCDIAVSEKKGNLSYQTYLYSFDNPYAFVKTEGYSDDILSFGHEFGHFVDAWYNRNATDSHDLSEVFSQGMEYLLLSYVPEKYREELREYKLLDAVDTFTEQGSYAEFEHRVYARPASEWTVEALNELSLELARDYGYFQAGDEEFYAKSWIDVTHLFEQPFYVISYCVSNVPAMEIYGLEQAEAGAGLDAWNRLLPREKDGFLETVMDQGELHDPFDADQMRQIAALIREKLQ